MWSKLKVVYTLQSQNLLIFKFVSATGVRRLYDCMLQQESVDRPVPASPSASTSLACNEFESTPGSKTQQLLWDSSAERWTLQRQHLLSPYFHPCLSQEDVLAPVSKFGKSVRHRGRKVKVFLLSLVRVKTPGRTEPWHIRVNRDYKVGSRITQRFHDVNSIYSGVLLRCDDGTTQLARVLAIVYVQRDKAGPVPEGESKIDVMVRRYLLLLDSVAS